MTLFAAGASADAGGTLGFGATLTRLGVAACGAALTRVVGLGLGTMLTGFGARLARLVSAGFGATLTVLGALGSTGSSGVLVTSTLAAGATSGDIDGHGEAKDSGVGASLPSAVSPSTGASDRVPSRVIGARHFRQWITVTFPATRSFHNRAGMLNFASQALHAMGNDIGFPRTRGQARFALVTAPEPEALHSKP